MPTKERRLRAQINTEAYARLIAEALPIPPRNDRDNARLTRIMFAIDEREEQATAEERAFAELLTVVIQAYEAEHYPMPRVEPHEALKVLMEERGLQHKDIWPVIGNKGLTSEILKGRRKISLAVAKRLAEHFRAPVELFI